MTQRSSRFTAGTARLVDCGAHGPGSGAELFVVEGDSAAAAVGRIRDASFQAVLPMRGKPLNTARAGHGRVAAHPLFAALAAAIGTGIGPDFDRAAIRFDRILLLMDPDADGIHCGLLLLLFFHRWMRPLLDGGLVEIVRPPWGEVASATEPVPRQAFSEAELSAVAARLRGLGPVASRRYRGLGGIEATVLHATCVAPASRRTEGVTASDVERMAAFLEAIEPDGR